MAKGNGSDINDDEILSDVEIVYALAKIKHFKDVVQTISIKRYSQEEYFDVVDAIFDDIFNPPNQKGETIMGDKQIKVQDIIELLEEPIDLIKTMTTDPTEIEHYTKAVLYEYLYPPKRSVKDRIMPRDFGRWQSKIVGPEKNNALR